MVISFQADGEALAALEVSRRRAKRELERRAVALVVLAPRRAGAACGERGRDRDRRSVAGHEHDVALAPNVGPLVVGLVDRLWRVPAAGGGAEALTPAEETARNPRYSPDGGSIVYQRLIDGQWDLWLLDLGTADRRALTSTTLDEIEPEFTADGRAVVFVSNRTGHFCLWSIDLASGVERSSPRSRATRRSRPLPSSVRSRISCVGGRSRSFACCCRPGHGELVSRNVDLGPPSWRPGGGVLVFSERDGVTTGSRCA